MVRLVLGVIFATDAWVRLRSGAPGQVATVTGAVNAALALVLLLGLARRAGYALGAVYTVFIWAAGEGFGGPYKSGATDIGTGIVYALLFTTLLVLAPPARRERLSLDRLLVTRWPWWRVLAEPHAVDRVVGAPGAEPAEAGRHQLGQREAVPDEGVPDRTADPSLR